MVGFRDRRQSHGDGERHSVKSIASWAVVGGLTTLVCALATATLVVAFGGIPLQHWVALRANAVRNYTWMVALLVGVALLGSRVSRELSASQACLAAVISLAPTGVLVALLTAVANSRGGEASYGDQLLQSFIVTAISAAVWALNASVRSRRSWTTGRGSSKYAEDAGRPRPRG
jgi:FtsH-binding integral membrane protein